MPKVFLNSRQRPKWRKWTSRFFRTRVPIVVPAVLTALLTLSLLIRPSVPVSPPVQVVHNLQSTGKNMSVLETCLNAPIEQLNSFDTYAATLKSRGIPQSLFENRFQQVVWDTLDMETSAYYPAESDKAWRVLEYGRGLPNDLLNFAKLTQRIGANGKLISFIHTRVDRVRGLQYVGLVRRDDGNDVLISARVPLGNRCQVQTVTLTTPVPRVHLIVPYSNREDRLRLLFENLFALRSRGTDIVAVVCVLAGAFNDINVAKRLSSQVFGEDWERVVSISENNGDVNREFSRGVALRDAIHQHVPKSESVVFLCDVDLLLTKAFVERCARNTIYGRQVYYPVFYSLYPYGNTDPAVGQFRGFWRLSSFGMTCLTRYDFDCVNAFGDAESRFQGWGSEDVYMHELIANSTDLIVVRAVEPGLIHRWHSKKCDYNSKDYWNCMKTNFVTMGHPLRIGPSLVQELQSETRLYQIASNA